MVKDIETIMKYSNEYINDVAKKIPIDKAYLYGSYANGTQKENSDVDICFFSSYFENKRKWDIVSELFYLKIKYDDYILIEPNAFPLSEINNNNPFVENVLRNGKEIFSKN